MFDKIAALNNDSKAKKKKRFVAISGRPTSKNKIKQNKTTQKLKQKFCCPQRPIHLKTK